MGRKARGARVHLEVHTVDGGEAEFLRDADRDGGWVLCVGGVPQSYVDLSDPTYLDFEYMQMMGVVVDAYGLAGAALDAVHIGGGGFTLPRYIAATRPGSRQVVFEPDRELVRLVRERLPVKDVPGLRIRITDGRAGMAALADEADDLVVLDAFAEASMPVELATRESTLEARRVLRPGGVYLMNVADGFRLAYVRRVVATVRTVFRHAVLLGEPDPARRGRRGRCVPLPRAGGEPADGFLRGSGALARRGRRRGPRAAAPGVRPFVTGPPRWGVRAGRARCVAFAYLPAQAQPLSHN
jgi:hypothetical protein